MLPNLDYEIMNLEDDKSSVSRKFPNLQLRNHECKWILVDDNSSVYSSILIYSHEFTGLLAGDKSSVSNKFRNLQLQNHECTCLLVDDKSSVTTYFLIYSYEIMNVHDYTGWRWKFCLHIFPNLHLRNHECTPLLVDMKVLPSSLS